MNYKHDIFISYSCKDKGIVLKYVEYLESLGYNVWYDVIGLQGGTEYSAHIAEAIETSKLLIFFSSENSNKSEWTKGEILLAKKINKPILPVKIDSSDYEKSLLIILLPLQYILCKGDISNQSRNSLKAAVNKHIGAPADNQSSQHHSTTCNIQKNARINILLSFISSIILSFAITIFSNEYAFNRALSFFAMSISIILCFASALFFIYFDKNWDKRHPMINSFLLQGIIFFLSYSILAFGFSFIDFNILKINFSSFICSVLSIYAIIRLMLFKKTGYYLLWICMALFSIGSYWWLPGFRPYTSICIAVIGSCGLLLLYKLLRKKHAGISMWKKLT